MEEREIIEDGYRDGIVLALTCTSTLAAGVNLPCSRVIISTPFIGISFLDATKYRQMSGRAGRKGKDESGESIVCARDKRELNQVLKMMNAAPTKCLSSLRLETSMTRLVLEGVASGLIQCVDNVLPYCHCSLIAKELSSEVLEEEIAKSLSFLLTQEMIQQIGTVDGTSVASHKAKLVPTKLGEAIFASGFSPEEGIMQYDELKSAMNKMILSQTLHALFLCTPNYP